MTKVGVSLSLAGAEMMIFFAPPTKWADAASAVVNLPVHSRIYSAPVSLHGTSVGSRVE